MLLGCDPEYILTKKRVPFSSIGLIGGSKIAPLDVKDGALQEDNVLAEININPSTNENLWDYRIASVTKQLKKMLPNDVIISKLTTARFPEEQLLHPQAQEFGCEPDMNAWNGRFNAPPKPPAFDFRSAGGHIHIGLDRNTSSVELQRIVRCLDTVVGLQSLLVDPDKERRLFYGKAGSMRKKPYGLEWRTLSNFWVFSSYDRRWIFQTVSWCIHNVEKISVFVSPEVENIINNDLKRESTLFLKSLYKKTKFPMHRRLECPG